MNSTQQLLAQFAIAHCEQDSEVTLAYGSKVICDIQREIADENLKLRKS